MSALTSNHVDDESLEDLHYCLVGFLQKKKCLLGRIELSCNNEEDEDPRNLPELKMSTPSKYR